MQILVRTFSVIYMPNATGVSADAKTVMRETDIGTVGQSDKVSQLRRVYAKPTCMYCQWSVPSRECMLQNPQSLRTVNNSKFFG